MARMREWVKEFVSTFIIYERYFLMCTVSCHCATIMGLFILKALHHTKGNKGQSLTLPASWKIILRCCPTSTPRAGLDVRLSMVELVFSQADVAFEVRFSTFLGLTFKLDMAESKKGR